MRILVLNHEFPPIGGGGGRAAEDICRVLAKRGHHVEVLTSWLKGLPRQEERDGYRVIRIPSLRRQPYRANLLSMSAYVLAGLWVGFRLIRAFQPDVIHVHFAVPAGALAFMLSRLTNIPYVLTAHLGDVPGGVPEKTNRWFRWILPFTYRIWNHAHRIVAVSEFTRRLAMKAYHVTIQVIPNGVDTKAMMPAQLHLNNPPRVLFVGRFMPQKNPLQVVRTMKELDGIAWQCVMIGDGPLMKDVKLAVAEAALSDRFHFTGWIEKRDVFHWLERCDILFMPSLSEGLPVVGVEALAKGLAIVASHVGGFVDLVDHDKNGYLIPQQSPDQFSSALRALLSDPARLLAFREASLEKAKLFDINRIVDEYEKIFVEVSRTGC
ncbi:MAG TPA: glycosyltransferase family 4 protein [Anaerolineales bacterium]|nr:glycosyltransferase family 4 protein [Anaerolineales bacterium]